MQTLSRDEQCHATDEVGYGLDVAIDEEPTEFGKRLRARREEVGITVSELAQAVGLTEGAVRQMERGLTKNAVLPNGLQIAWVLGVSPWWLVSRHEPKLLAGQPDTVANRIVALSGGVAGSGQGSPMGAALAQSIVSRMRDPSDDVFAALQVHLEELVTAAMLKATKDLKQRLVATDKSLLKVIDRLSQIESARSAPAPRQPKNRKNHQ